jgi:hypothetical protein
VKAERSGRSGWVRSAVLIDELPRATRPSRAAEPASAAPAPGPEPGESPTTQQGEGAEPEAPPPPEKSVFDPY